MGYPDAIPPVLRPICVAACAAATIAGLGVARRPLRAAWLTAAVERASSAADDPLRFPTRLSLPDAGSRRWVNGLFVRSATNGSAYAAADRLSDLRKKMRGDDVARVTGTMFFLARDYDKASAAFASVRRPTARDWNNLAASTLAEGLKRADEGRWLAALAAADRALTLDPDLADARFNRALAVEQLGVAPVAAARWQHYLNLDSDSGWSRRAAIGVRPLYTDAAAWRAQRIDEQPAEAFAPLAAKFPQHARLWAEGVFLSAWADAMSAGDERNAERQLRRAQVIGEALQRERGESLVADSVRVIEDARGPHLGKLIAGHLSYRTGRLALRDGDYATAQLHLRTAHDALTAARSPMAAVAEVYAAIAVRNQNQTAEALRVLRAVQARTNERYPALRGRIQHEIALCEAVLGHWSDSIAAARESMTIFSSLGERGHAAAAEAILSENFDFLGQPERAWRHGVSALRSSCMAGELDRARVTLAAITRTEMRGRRWERARAVARLENELAEWARDARMDAGMFLRIAAIESHLSGLHQAEDAIRRARSSAGSIPDPSTRDKLMADIDGAAGAMQRKRDPRGALVLLSAAITFQQRAARPIMLPELYLERGRTHLALDALQAAAEDYESGIVELERQRSRVSDAELRPGLFDDSFELFDEAISLQVQRGGDAAAVLRYVERGRARSLLEQLDANEDQTGATALALSDVQRRLPPSHVLVEYASLPGELLIIVIAGDRNVLRRVAASRDELAAATRAFLMDVSSNAANSRLFELLIAPIADEIRAAEALTIVTDDVLQRVPFAALREGAAESFLIERRSIALAPSAALFVVTTDRLRETARTPPADIVVFANPSIPRDAFPLLPDLRAAEGEAALIARLYPNGNVFIRDEASAERFLRVAPAFSVVQFAGHAVTHNADPASSSLVCASTDRRHGALTQRMIGRMRFRTTRVVVLAACSTMTGRNAAVEGVPSIARAFLVAGVPAVVGTLWDIEDAEAVFITRTLHEHLARGVSAASALRGAQVAAIRSGKPIRQWAAFSVTGSAQ